VKSDVKESGDSLLEKRMHNDRVKTRADTDEFINEVESGNWMDASNANREVVQGEGITNK